MKTRSWLNHTALQLMALIGLMLASASVSAQNGVAQVFYVPVDETHYRDLAIAVNTSNAGDDTAPNPDTVRTVISLSVFVDATTIIYDHWEDGYEADLLNPVQGTTQTLLRSAGDFEVFQNDVFVSPRDPASILFDSRDRIVTTEQIAVTRAGWRLQEATLLAGATAVFPTFDWGTNFEVAMGEDVANHNMFEYTSVSITTGDRGAVVSVDADADGTFESNITINPGDTTLVNNIQLGATLVSTDPVQMYALTGDRDTTYASRWFVLVPRDQWDNSYYNPTGTTDAGDAATVHLYNPGTSAIDVTTETLNSTFATNTYDNTTAGTLDNAVVQCGTASLDRTFTVADNFTVAGVNLGLNIDHTYRGDIQAILESPTGTRVTLVAIDGGDGDNNYDLLLDRESANAIDDNNADATAAPFYDRSAAPSNSDQPFLGETSNGTWTLELCDNFDGDTGTYNRAQLQLLEETGTGQVTSIVNVPAGGLTEFTMPLNSAGRFFTAGFEDFFAYVTMDYDDTAHDWGFTLLPEESLTTTLAVGYAVGRDPTSAVNPNENGSPIWVTANGTTTIFVDYDGDQNTPGGVCPTCIDSNGNFYDVEFNVTELESIRIYDSTDGDQSGMLIYTLDGTLLQASWGQDPTTASPGQPGLDLGTTVLPIRRVRVSKEGILVNDLDGDGGIDPGDTIRYRIEVTNVSDTPIDDVFTEDNGLDANVTYVSGTTEVDGVVLADDGVGATIFPLDEGGINLGTLQPGQVVVILFRAQINDPFPIGVPAVTNGVEVRADNEFEVDTSLSPVGDPTLAITKVSDAVGDLLPGDTVNYTITVTNTSAVTQNGLKVLDTLPEGTVYVPESTSVTGFNAQSSSVNTYSDSADINTNDDCLTPEVQLINVPDSFLIGDIEFGYLGTNTRRSDIEVVLESPSGTRIEVISGSLTSDFDDNYNVLLDDASANPLDDNSDDDVGVAFPARTAQPSNALNAFINENAQGNWRVEICDVDLAVRDSRYLGSLLQLTSLDSFTSITKTNANAAPQPLLDGSPTNVVLAPDEFSLRQNDTMTMTYSVTVSDPLDINVINISNTAIATSLENPFPVVATVVDPITAGGTIGDRVWLDTDGDGIQDVGEPGLSNVTVNIFSTGPDGNIGGGDDVLIGTQSTDPNGNYLFERLFPGEYYVDVDGTTLPAGLTTSPGTTDPSAEIPIAAEEIILTIDFGYTNADPNTGIIGDYVWSDADSDGIQDPGEPGIGGVTVELIDNGGNVIATTTTTPDGSYLFVGVNPGEYSVRMQAAEFAPGGDLEGFTATSGPQSEGANQSDPFTVTAGDILLDVDFGFNNATTFSITDSVWLDVDADGVFDATESGIMDVTVNLLDNLGNIIASTDTDVNGDFSFTGVSPGNYTLSISDNDGELNGLAGTTVAGRSRSQAVTVVAADVVGENFGYNAPGTIGDRIWSDADGDGVQDPGEVGISGVTVELVDRSGAVVDSQVTGPNGEYLFDGVAPELFTIRVTPPAGYTQTGDPDGTLDDESAFTLLLGESNLDQDFGYQNTALPDLSGTVFSDLNANGVEQPGEPGFAGVSLDLLREIGGVFSVVGTTVTDSQGNYTFPDLPDGNYRVSVTDNATVLDGFELTSGLDTIGVTMAGVDVTDIDFGYARDPDIARITDIVWLDSDGDGVFDANEQPISGVSVNLYEDTDGDGLFDPNSDTLIGTDLSDPDGFYLFDGLPAGNYFVDVVEATVPADLVPTTFIATGYSNLIALSEGETAREAPFGFQPSPTTTALSGATWVDADNDGNRDPGEAPIPGVLITVLDQSDGSTAATTTTAADGSWLVTGLPPGDYVIVYEETDIPAGLDETQPTNLPPGDDTYTVSLAAGESIGNLDFGFFGAGAVLRSIAGTIYNDQDSSFLQNGTEPGIASVTLALVDDMGNTVATSITDLNGNYSFSGLIPDGGDPDNYTVVITDNNGALDNFNPTQLLPASVNIAPGDVTDVDAGYVAGSLLGSVGNQIWLDLNTDGVFNVGEPGISNVTVQCWLDSDQDGAITPGIDNLIRSTQTDLNGEYTCDSLPSDFYVVTVTDDAGVLSDAVKTLGAGGTSASYSDVDGASKVDPYALITMSPNLTADFGYAGTRSLSGTVFADLSNDGVLDAGEDRVQSATLTLYRDLDGDGVIDPSDAVFGTTQSAADGTYSFTNLPEGRYIVAVNVGGTSVDGDTQTTQVSTSGVQPVNLTGGNTNSTGNDFGFYMEPVTTPVTLSSFLAQPINGGLSVSWTTETEVGNVGFFLFAETGDGVVTPLGDLRPSHVVDSVTQQQYSAYIENSSASTLWIEDIDILGVRTRHGPFQTGQQYGQTAGTSIRATNWSEIASESDRKEQIRQSLIEEPNAAVIRVSETGMQRITYEALLAAGIDLTGTPVNQLRVTLDGVAQPIHVSGAGTTFTAGASIHFYGQSLESLYSRERAYKLIQSSSLPGAWIENETAAPGPINDQAHYRQQTVLNADNRYSFSSPNGDPWYQDELFAYGNSDAITYDLPISELREGTATVALDLWTVTDLPDVVDHRLVARINQVPLLDERVDGLQVVERQFSIDTALLVNGNNPVDVEARLEDGVLFSLANTEAISIEYPRNLVAMGNQLDFVAINASTAAAAGSSVPDGSGNLIFSDGFEVASAGNTIEVTGFSDSQIVVYGIGPDSGSLMTAAEVDGQAGSYSVRFVSSMPEHHYVATTLAAMKTPELAPLSNPVDLLRGTAEYLMIAHPDFIDDIQPLATHHRNQGLNVRVVNLQDVYDIFTDGVIDPAAIDQYIAHAITQQGTRFVLLVGGDSYDYMDNLGLGSKSFIPSHYVRTGPIVAFTPTDAPYADIDGDLRPDVALGRLPARSSSELQAMVSKTLQYATLNTGGLAVFASDRSGPDGDFKLESQSLEDGLSGLWSITTAHLDDQPVEMARQTIIDSIEGGVSLTSYFGHSGPDSWSFDSLFTTEDAFALNNASAATVVTQWGCWNTYYVSPQNDSMAHGWLTTGNGAAAVLGAATLTQTESDRELGKLLMPLLTQPGMPLGQALMDAKRALVTTHPELIDVLLGFTLLGDPAMSLQTSN